MLHQIKHCLSHRQPTAILDPQQAPSQMTHKSSSSSSHHSATASQPWSGNRRLLTSTIGSTYRARCASVSCYRAVSGTDSRHGCATGLAAPSQSAVDILYNQMSRDDATLSSPEPEPLVNPAPADPAAADVTSSSPIPAQADDTSAGAISSDSSALLVTDYTTAPGGSSNTHHTGDNRSTGVDSSSSMPMETPSNGDNFNTSTSPTPEPVVSACQPCQLMKPLLHHCRTPP
ncbi:hypothetical protein COO60DRAFT_405213 [Scenedesmus sp. NREL 46B-D3]|nr:hypothetical protein COO60DRAFT_405213 [Scenedesmus sp. NREL 46B-D3]